MKLWPHQVEAVEACRAVLQLERSRVLVQFPTGAGKSEVATEAALLYLELLRHPEQLAELLRAGLR